jgi:hypothetical protein
MSRILGTDPDGGVSEALAISQLSVGAVLHNTGPMPFAGGSVVHILISGVALAHEREECPLFVRSSRMDIPADQVMSDESQLVGRLPHRKGQRGDWGREAGCGCG